MSDRNKRKGFGWGMNTETQSIVVALLGGLLLSITLSGRFTSYVRPGFKPLLLIGGGILVAVGVLSLILAIMADVNGIRLGSWPRRSARLNALQGFPAAVGRMTLQNVQSMKTMRATRIRMGLTPTGTTIRPRRRRG